MTVLPRRLLCSGVEAPRQMQRPVKQVTKSNFAASAEEMAGHVSDSDFVALSLRRTGSFSAVPWHRPLPIDTAAAAYSKAKSAAERFQLFQLALCPFSLQSPSKLRAHPYNYVLFPRDELKLGLPAYSFSCQSSHLTSMANEGFDFNACVYDGISYVSRAQESAARIWMGNPKSARFEVDLGFSPSVADSVFVDRIRLRIVSWTHTCKRMKERNSDTLISSLGKIILASQFHGDRPCTEIDVCSERQVQLVLQLLRDFSELVPLVVPAKSGGTQAVRVVFTSSKEDKELLKAELLQMEEKESKQVRGFREVIDLIAASQKPVVSHDSLADFTFIYSKFIGPLPPTVDEFASSLREVFPNVIDVGHMMKAFRPLRKVTDIPVAISYLNNHFSAPVDVQIPQQVTENEGGIHGDDVVRTCHLFAKLCSILKIGHRSTASNGKVILAPALEKYSNVFNTVSSTAPRESTTNERTGVWTKSTRKVSCSQLAFVWGFSSGMTAGKLKSSLNNSHYVFSEPFDVLLVDKSCALVVFWKPGSAEMFLNVMNHHHHGLEITGSLREMVSEGLRSASYETYKRVCNSAILEMDLGESLDKALELGEADSEATSKEIFRCSESMINFDELDL